jgi:asparagine N-glycosylation enzyme membrane subunit Stt3
MTEAEALLQQSSASAEPPKSSATLNVFSGMVQTMGIPAAIANLVFPAILSILTVILVFVVISSLTTTKM